MGKWNLFGSNKIQLRSFPTNSTMSISVLTTTMARIPQNCGFQLVEKLATLLAPRMRIGHVKRMACGDHWNEERLDSGCANDQVTNSNSEARPAANSGRNADTKAYQHEVCSDFRLALNWEDQVSH